MFRIIIIYNLNSKFNKKLIDYKRINVFFVIYNTNYKKLSKIPKLTNILFIHVIYMNYEPII